MRVSSTYGSLGDIEPIVGFAVQSRTLAGQGRDALVATGVTLVGALR